MSESNKPFRTAPFSLIMYSDMRSKIEMLAKQKGLSMTKMITLMLNDWLENDSDEWREQRHRTYLRQLEDDTRKAEAQRRMNNRSIDHHYGLPQLVGGGKIDESSVISTRTLSDYMDENG